MLITSASILGLPVLSNAEDYSHIYSLDEALSPRYLGSKEAPLQLVEFVSMTCSHCADFHINTLPLLKEKYIKNGLLRVEMRDFPLDGLALRAAAMARLADPKKYYKLIDILFKNQESWSRTNNPIEELQKIGRLAGLNNKKLEASVNSMPLLEGIFQMRQTAEKRWKIQSTPSFVINDEIMISGSLPLKEFEDVFKKYKS